MTTLLTYIKNNILFKLMTLQKSFTNEPIYQKVCKLIQIIIDRLQIPKEIKIV